MKCKMSSAWFYSWTFAIYFIFMNEISFASKHSSLILLADDTNIFLSNSYLSALQNTVCSELSVLLMCFAASKISFNASKTTVFNSCNRNYTFNIHVESQQTKQDDHSKFLGVYIEPIFHEQITFYTFEIRSLNVYVFSVGWNIFYPWDSFTFLLFTTLLLLLYCLFKHHNYSSFI